MKAVRHILSLKHIGVFFNGRQPDLKTKDNSTIADPSSELYFGQIHIYTTTNFEPVHLVVHTMDGKIMMRKVISLMRICRLSPQATICFG